MGEPIRIVDLARRVIELCGAPASTRIEFIGLRPGEKIDEDLVGANEHALQTEIPHIAEIRSIVPLRETFLADVAVLEALAVNGRPEETIDQLRAIVPEFVPAAAAIPA
jgi:FlaA1/EpsC-like NDP-sugar epimerase